MSTFNDKTKGTIQLAGGRGSIRYRIQAPVELKDSEVVCVVGNPMNLRKRDVVDLSKIVRPPPIDTTVPVYALSGVREGDEIVYTITSTNTRENATIPYSIVEDYNYGLLPGEVITVTGSNTYPLRPKFYLKSNIASSTSLVSVDMTEQPTNKSLPALTRQTAVQLRNGTGEIEFYIPRAVTNPQPYTVVANFGRPQFASVTVNLKTHVPEPQLYLSITTGRVSPSGSISAKVTWHNVKPGSVHRGVIDVTFRLYLKTGQIADSIYGPPSQAIQVHGESGSADVTFNYKKFSEVDSGKIELEAYASIEHDGSSNAYRAKDSSWITD